MICFLVGLGSSLFFERKVGTESEVFRITSLPGFDTRRLPPKKARRMGDVGKAAIIGPPGEFLFGLNFVF